MNNELLLPCLSSTTLGLYLFLNSTRSVRAKKFFEKKTLVLSSL
jgi:UPF0716 family protein affecting phage T7 exclusion